MILIIFHRSWTPDLMCLLYLLAGYETVTWLWTRCVWLRGRGTRHSKIDTWLSWTTSCSNINAEEYEYLFLTIIIEIVNRTTADIVNRNITIYVVPFDYLTESSLVNYKSRFIYKYRSLLLSFNRIF